MNKLLVSTLYLIIIALLALGIDHSWSIFSYHETEELEKDATRIGYHQARLIETQFEKTLSAAISLGLMVNNNDFSENSFEAIASDIISYYSGVTCLQLAPGGIVSKIFPLEGHETAIGHNLLSDPNRKNDALRAIATKKLTLTGPINLIQKGLSFVGRYPVFLTDKEQQRKFFWGFTIVLIDFNFFLEQSQIHSLGQYGYNYSLYKFKEKSNQKVIIYESGNSLSEKAIVIEINIPNGKWFLALELDSGKEKDGKNLHQYEKIYIIVTALIVFCAITIIFLFSLKLAENNRILSDKVELAEKAEEASNSYKKQLKTVIHSQSNVEERERQRIARELHDQVGQLLSVVKIKQQRLRESIPNKEDQDFSDEITELIEQIFQDVRSLTFDLSLLVTYRNDLNAAIEGLGQKVFSEEGLIFNFETEGKPLELEEENLITLTQIARELYYNVLKHACASQVRSLLKWDTNKIILTVIDDGVGFQNKDVLINSGVGKNFGLLFLKERVEKLNGQMEIESSLGSGCTVVVSVPS